MTPTILASRERKIERMMQETGCSREYAIAYLMSAAWFVPAAVDNYNATH
jgi:hypothetical protein